MKGNETCICGHSSWMHHSYTGHCHNPDRVNTTRDCRCRGFHSGAESREKFERALDRWTPHIEGGI